MNMLQYAHLSLFDIEFGHWQQHIITSNEQIDRDRRTKNLKSWPFKFETKHRFPRKNEGKRKSVLKWQQKRCKLLIHLFESTNWQYDETMSNSNRGKMLTGRLVLEEQSLVTKGDLGIHALKTLKYIHWVDICTIIRVFKSQRRGVNDPRLRRRWLGRKKLNKFRRSTGSRSSVNGWSAQPWMDSERAVAVYYHLRMLGSWLSRGRSDLK